MTKWSEFRSLHKGQKQSEISKLWAQYKAGEYDIPRGIEADQEEETQEIQREEEEVEVLETYDVAEEFAAQNKIAEMIDEEHPQLLEEVEEVLEATEEVIDSIIEEETNPELNETTKKFFLGFL